MEEDSYPLFVVGEREGLQNDPPCSLNDRYSMPKYVYSFDAY